MKFLKVILVSLLVVISLSDGLSQVIYNNDFTSNSGYSTYRNTSSSNCPGWDDESPSSTSRRPSNGSGRFVRIRSCKGTGTLRTSNFVSLSSTFEVCFAHKFDNPGCGFSDGNSYEVVLYNVTKGIDEHIFVAADENSGDIDELFCGNYTSSYAPGDTYRLEFRYYVSVNFCKDAGFASVDNITVTNACANLDYTVTTVCNSDINQEIQIDIDNIYAESSVDVFINGTQYGNNLVNGSTLNQTLSGGVHDILIESDGNPICYRREFTPNCDRCSNVNSGGNTCLDAPLIINDFNQVKGSTMCSYSQYWPSENGGSFYMCGSFTVQNDQYFKVIGTGQNLTIDYTIYEDGVPAFDECSEGIQIQVLSGSCGNMTPIGNCETGTGGGTNNINALASGTYDSGIPLNSGEEYFVVIDGKSNDYCKIDLTFNNIQGNCSANAGTWN